MQFLFCEAFHWLPISLKLLAYLLQPLTVWEDFSRARVGRVSFVREREEGSVKRLTGETSWEFRTGYKRIMTSCAWPFQKT